jgi:hypothetical protein
MKVHMRDSRILKRLWQLGNEFSNFISLVKYMSLNAWNRIRSHFSTFTPVKSFIHVSVLFSEWRDALKINSWGIHLYVKKFGYHWNYRKINKSDSGGLAVVHFVISSNANMYERLDWRKNAKMWATSVSRVQRHIFHKWDEFRKFIT